MLITPVSLPPMLPTTTQPDVVANGLHNVQMQAAAPITPDAVAPPPKGERSNKSKERRKEGRKPSVDQDARNRGENINFSV